MTTRLSPQVFFKHKATQFAVLLAATALFTQSTAMAAARWYEVEVLVFAQMQPDFSTESWTRDVGFPNLQGALLAPSLNARPAVLADPAFNQSVDAMAANDALRVAAVPAAPFRLTDVLRSLSRNKSYRPVLHTAWKQAVGTGKDSFKLRIAGGKDFSAQFGQDGSLLLQGAAPALPYGLWEIDGFIKLSAVRYLHAETDLIFRRLNTETTTATNTGATPVPNLLTETPITTQSQSKAEHIQSYRSSQNRRVKANELTYFDHPAFGILLQLRALDADKVDASETPPIIVPPPSTSEIE